MFAIFKTGSKQFRVAKGDQICVEKLPQKVGEKIIFDEVLLFSDGEKVEIGTPVLKDFKVEAKVLSHEKAEKITVVKFKPKKRYSRKIGHRQPFSKIEIVKIAAAKPKSTTVKK